MLALGRVATPFVYKQWIINAHKKKTRILLLPGHVFKFKPLFQADPSGRKGKKRKRGKKKNKKTAFHGHASKAKIKSPDWSSKPISLVVTVVSRLNAERFFSPLAIRCHMSLSETRPEFSVKMLDGCPCCHSKFSVESVRFLSRGGFYGEWGAIP